MRITSIELENIRCFEHAVVSFRPGEQTAPWGLVLGENGTGKTTLLRSLALGLCSPKMAAALFEDAGGAWLRAGTTSGAIRIGLDSGESAELTLRMAGYGERIDRHTATDESVWNRVFVCGYGAARRAFGDRSFAQYSPRDSVSTLFNYDAPLQNPELFLRRLSSADVDPADLLRAIDRILMLPPGSTRLATSGLEVAGPWGSYTPLGALGDGYRATLAWILDLLGWAMMRNPEMLKNGIRGTVLVDEIEQHLHPTWQRRILSLLRAQFPDVQFIATTHSPLCVVGTTDLDDRDVAMVLLRQTEEGVEADSGLRPPRGQRADQILTSYLFGLETTGDDRTKYEVERLARLLGRETLSPFEREEVEQLRTSLEEKLGSEETELERQVASLIPEVLDERLQRHVAKMMVARSGSARYAVSPQVSAAELEMKRQLRQLLE